MNTVRLKSCAAAGSACSLSTWLAHCSKVRSALQPCSSVTSSKLTRPGLWRAPSASPASFTSLGATLRPSADTLVTPAITAPLTRTLNLKVR